MKKFIIPLMIAGMMLPANTFARSVFLNGVDISSVRNQTFTKATVAIDNEGNVRIDAPGYEVKLIEPAESKPLTPSASDSSGSNPALKNKYYLITQPSTEGRAQYDFVVVVNGVERKTIEAGSPQMIMEISAWLQKGDNDIIIKALKNLTNGRKSSAKEDEARLLIGTGHEENKVVKISSVKANVKVNASLTTNVIKQIVITAE